ncbi:MAG: hypothetical protein DRP30_01340 [Thermotoga sp.]|nr:MAG: hypothetical protein DRP30_01340 [Thermotoga sp.]HDM70115.1 hypothetical protein [Thermotogales bacterium]
MRNLVERFVMDLKRKAYSNLTIEEYRREIRRFQKFMEGRGKNLLKVDRDDVEEFLCSLSSGPRAINRTVSVLRKFYKFLKSRNLVEENPMENVEFSKVNEENPVFLNEREYEMLRKNLKLDGDEDFLSLRNKTMIRVLLSTGLRVSELVNLKVRDVHFDDLGAVLEVRRKGNRMDLVYLGRENAEVLKRYMSIRNKNVESSEYLFVSRTGKRIDRSMIYRIVKEFFKLSGLRKKKMGPHVLRHTFATMLMRKNVSIYKIKELLNHKRITTTERYLHLVEDDLRKTLEEVGL